MNEKLVLKEGQTAGIRTDQRKESNPALETLFRPEEEEIEWLSKIKNEVDKIDGGDNIIEIADVEEDQSQGGQIEPLKMIRKGAVAAVGGTMVGVGLVMIPLPTPFGAVIASAGLGVLGTEFNEAKELNDKLIDGAKGHLNTARDAIVNGIERMNDDEGDQNKIQNDRDNKYNNKNNDDGNDNTFNNTDVSSGLVAVLDAKFDKVKELNDELIEGSKGRPNNTCVQKIENVDRTDQGEEKGKYIFKDGKIENEQGGNNKEKDDGNSNLNKVGKQDDEEESPWWLSNMNQTERARQEKIAKEMYRKENQTSYEQTKEYLTKRTGKFLSHNILPYIKRKEEELDPHNGNAEIEIKNISEPETTTH